MEPMELDDYSIVVPARTIIGSMICDPHASGTVLASWNVTLERAEFETVIWNANRQTSLSLLDRQAFRHRPAYVPSIPL
jgi:hypothetical protein